MVENPFSKIFEVFVQFWLVQVFFETVFFDQGVNFGKKFDFRFEFKFASFGVFFEGVDASFFDFDLGQFSGVELGSRGHVGDDVCCGDAEYYQNGEHIFHFNYFFWNLTDDTSFVDVPPKLSQNVLLVHNFWVGISSHEILVNSFKFFEILA